MYCSYTKSNYSMLRKKQNHKNFPSCLFPSFFEHPCWHSFIYYPVLGSIKLRGRSKLVLAQGNQVSLHIYGLLPYCFVYNYLKMEKTFLTWGQLKAGGGKQKKAGGGPGLAIACQALD